MGYRLGSSTLLLKYEHCVIVEHSVTAEDKASAEVRAKKAQRHGSAVAVCVETFFTTLTLKNDK